MKSFRAGDLVKLKSGSPTMTVTGEGSYDGQVSVIWFVGDDGPKHANIEEEALIKADSNAQGNNVQQGLNPMANTAQSVMP